MRSSVRIVAYCGDKLAAFHWRRISHIIRKDMKTSIIYSEDFAKYDYGAGHPLRSFRLKLTYELMNAYGLLSLPDVPVIQAIPAEEKYLLLYHTRDYIDMLNGVNNGSEIPGVENYGLGYGDNPVFKGVYEWSRLVTGASLQAAELVDSGAAPISFNVSGGLHHALAAKASGFCYINDPVIVIYSLLRKGKRVAYIDIDAHHCDGVQDAFYRTDKVLTISFHESGLYLFPGTGFETEIGEGEGRGYSVNIPMPPSSDDELFVYSFEEVVPSLLKKFKPDIVVSQLGVDSFITDPLAHLKYTTNGFCEVVGKIKDLSPRWIALGGGGYDVTNVAKAWTLAWAIMNEVDLPNALPEAFLEQYPLDGFRSHKLRDKEYQETGAQKKKVKNEVSRVISWIKENVFPLISTSTQK